tara:strand:- start:132 stop:596 length:465 start_codon:yes stop_codon:yes gene_type:complete
MNNYINIYNNLIKLTRNKSLYMNIKNEETFSIRLTLFLFHFAFFLKVYKKNNDKKIMQEIYDYNFKQLEVSIREIGYGDVSINKKMKDYLNLFHKIIGYIDKWDNLDEIEKSEVFINFLDKNSNSTFFIEYFDDYLNILKNNSLNYFINNIIET